MRILVITGSDQAAENEALSSSSNTLSFRRRPTVTLRLGDTEVHYVPVRSERETEKFRGQRYDLTIEDHSFNPERSHEKCRWLRIVQMMVLR